MPESVKCLSQSHEDLSSLSWNPGKDNMESCACNWEMLCWLCNKTRFLNYYLYTRKFLLFRWWFFFPNNFLQLSFLFRFIMPSFSIGCYMVQVTRFCLFSLILPEACLNWNRKLFHFTAGKMFLCTVWTLSLYYTNTDFWTSREDYRLDFGIVRHYLSHSFVSIPSLAFWLVY